MGINEPFRGTGVAMVTPFNHSGEVDFDRLILHTERLINSGVNYLVVLGTTAETPTLSAGERKDVIRCVTEACAGRLPIMVGAGGNDTRAVIEQVRSMNLEGVDALLTVVPYYNKPGQEGIYQHFSALAAASPLPLMLYNVPGRTGANMNAETVLRLATDYPERVIAVKEASGDLGQISAMIREKPSGFLVVSGDDAFTLPLIALGAAGVVSVIGNAYPARFSTMVAAALDGANAKAREIYYQLYPMMKAIFKEGNPAGIKAAMETRGWIENVLRLPLVPVSESLHAEIRELHRMLG
jgi:4-hydroxy-tetrahydrodipicolinate synthase